MDVFRAAFPSAFNVGDDEVLLDDSRRYVERAIVAGVDAGSTCGRACTWIRRIIGRSRRHTGAGCIGCFSLTASRKEIDDAYVPESRLDALLSRRIAPFY